jgi:hypothetical protein
VFCSSLQRSQRSLHVSLTVVAPRLKMRSVRIVRAGAGSTPPADASSCFFLSPAPRAPRPRDGTERLPKDLLSIAKLAFVFPRALRLRCCPSCEHRTRTQQTAFLLLVLTPFVSPILMWSVASAVSLHALPPALASSDPNAKGQELLSFASFRPKLGTFLLVSSPQASRLSAGTGIRRVVCFLFLSTKRRRPTIILWVWASHIHSLLGKEVFGMI